ncbi:hypothetical protein O3P69_017539 [Scylla paramamosain]|uniref:Uncharacterized protein n=1 Tax=Scylla paramamosain TaxID=85552 RepID=A0AAW0TWY5_SCYPA
MIRLNFYVWSGGAGCFVTTSPKQLEEGCGVGSAAELMPFEGGDTESRRGKPWETSVAQQQKSHWNLVTDWWWGLQEPTFSL